MRHANCSNDVYYVDECGHLLPPKKVNIVENPVTMHTEDKLDCGDDNKIIECEKKG